MITFFPDICRIFVLTVDVTFMLTFFFSRNTMKSFNISVQCAVTTLWEQTLSQLKWGQLRWHLNSPSAYPFVTRCGLSFLDVLSTILDIRLEPGTLTIAFSLFSSIATFSYIPCDVAECKLGKCNWKSSSGIDNTFLTWFAFVLRRQAVSARIFNE